jgi:hypothetical protein
MLAVEREAAAPGVKLPKAARAITNVENVVKLPASHTSISDFGFRISDFRIENKIARSASRPIHNPPFAI